MECTKCHFENPDDSSFCGKCATPLLSLEEISATPTKTLEKIPDELTRGTTFASRYGGHRRALARAREDNHDNLPYLFMAEIGRQMQWSPTLPYFRIQEFHQECAFEIEFFSVWKFFLKVYEN